MLVDETVRAVVDGSGSIVIVGVYGPPEDFATLDAGELDVIDTLFIMS